jgi:hypothetical protein
VNVHAALFLINGDNAVDQNGWHGEAISVIE